MKTYKHARRVKQGFRFPRTHAPQTHLQSPKRHPRNVVLAGTEHAHKHAEAEYGNSISVSTRGLPKQAAANVYKRTARTKRAAINSEWTSVLQRPPKPLSRSPAVAAPRREKERPGKLALLHASRLV
ncbi:hypothetical protein MRX96_056756 [Rhipicephalus microplus]